MADAGNDPELRKKAVENLANGLVSTYEPVLKNTGRMLLELSKRQEVLCRILHAENWKICEAYSNPDYQEIFAKLKYLRTKLVEIKRTMIMLHDKTHKLKARVLKLEQNKQNEARYRAQQRAKEEQLIGKFPTT